MRRLRTTSAVAAVAVIMALAGCSSGEASDPSAIKGSFDIGGRSLYLECTGTGTPTIVMDAGLGNSHTTWAKVVPDVRGADRTCTYDRANIGASDKAPTPRTSSDVVDDLHRLLEAAKVPAPYVLVGHSFAGMSMRLFASTYPNEVVGLVLVDPTPPTFIDDECAIVDAGLCDRLRADASPTKNPEGLDIDASAKALAAAGPLPAVPMIVLAATVHHQATITDLCRRGADRGAVATTPAGTRGEPPDRSYRGRGGRPRHPIAAPGGGGRRASLRARDDLSGTTRRRSPTSWSARCRLLDGDA